MRITPANFDNILHLIQAGITKQDITMRQSISPEIKLLVEINRAISYLKTMVRMFSILVKQFHWLKFHQINRKSRTYPTFKKSDQTKFIMLKTSDFGMIHDTINRIILIVSD